MCGMTILLSGSVPDLSRHKLTFLVCVLMEHQRMFGVSFSKLTEV